MPSAILPFLETSTVLTPVLSVLQPTVLPSDNLKTQGLRSNVFKECVTVNVVRPPANTLETVASALSKSTANEGGKLAVVI